MCGTVWDVTDSHWQAHSALLLGPFSFCVLFAEQIELHPFALGLKLFCIALKTKGLSFALH